MTKYKIEVYKKGAKSPYDVFIASLPNATKPTYTKYEECFGGRLDKLERVRIYYARNGGLVATKYRDRNGNGRLRWVR